MKIVIFLSFCIVIAAAKSYGGYEGETRFLRVQEPFVPIRRYLSQSDNYGTYNFETESADGTSRQESGNLKNVNNELVSVKSGSYEWTAPEGERFHVDYTADELGFHPVMTRLSGVPLAARVLPAPLIRNEFLQRDFPAPIVREEINSYGQPAIRIPAPIIREELVNSYDQPAIRIPAPIIREELVNSYAPERELIRVPAPVPAYAPAVDTIRFGTSFSEPAAPLRFLNRVEAPLLNQFEAPLLNRFEAPLLNRFEAPLLNRVEAPLLNRFEAPLVAGTTRFGLPGTQTWGDFETPEFTILSSNPSNTFVRIGLP